MDAQVKALFNEVASIRKRLNELAPNLSKLEAPKYNDTPLRQAISRVEIQLKSQINELKKDDSSSKKLQEFVESEIAKIQRSIDNKPVFDEVPNSELVGWQNGQPIKQEFNSFLPTMSKGDLLQWNGTELVGLSERPELKATERDFQNYDFKDINDGKAEWVVSENQHRYTWVDAVYFQYPQEFVNKKGKVKAEITIAGSPTRVVSQMNMQKIKVDMAAPIKVSVSLSETEKLTSGLLQVWVQKTIFTQ